MNYKHSVNLRRAKTSAEEAALRRHLDENDLRLKPAEGGGFFILHACGMLLNARPAPLRAVADWAKSLV